MMLSIIPLIGIASLAHNRYRLVALMATIAVTLICCLNAMDSSIAAVIVTAALASVSLTLSNKNAHCYLLVSAAIITTIHMAPIQITLGNKKITQGIIVVQE